MIKAEIAMAFTSTRNVWKCIFYGGKFDGDLAPKSAGEIDWGVSWLLRCIHVFGGISFLRGHFEVHLFPRERIFKRMRRRFQKRSPMDPCFPGLEEG
jgi:hypothetical protein